MGKFFIARPIFAIALAAAIVLLGIISIFDLPIEQYPDITPPVVEVSTTYPGADAETVNNAVATPVSQSIMGVSDMLYMQATSANDGSMNLQVTFDIGSDPNMDAIFTQNNVSTALSQLPASVTQQGVTTRKTMTGFLLVFSLHSDGRYDAEFLSNYAYINLQNELLKIDGVGKVSIMGAGEYAMRVWLKPDVLKYYGIPVSAVTAAIENQGGIYPAGQFGAEPAPDGTTYTYTVTMPPQITTPAQFGDIVVVTTSEGQQIRLCDVAEVSLGSQSYGVSSLFEGKPTAMIVVYQQPGSNAVEVGKKVRAAMARLEKRMPDGIAATTIVDTTTSIDAGIRDIFHTLVIALILVIFIIYLFIQDWRATVIPLVAIPVSLIGAFALFPLLGFSVNIISLLGLVLAIGLVVDDAIVVVEAAQVNIAAGMRPRAAALEAMKNVASPIVATTVVLLAVFVPVSFTGGITGRLFQQFSITIAVSVVISAFNALTLSPALCALLLRRREPPQKGFFRRLQPLLLPQHGSLYGLYADAYPPRDAHGRIHRRGTRGHLRRMAQAARGVPPRGRPGLRHGDGLHARSLGASRHAGRHGRGRRRDPHPARSGLDLVRRGFQHDGGHRLDRQRHHLRLAGRLRRPQTLGHGNRTETHRRAVRRRAGSRVLCLHPALDPRAGHHVGRIGRGAGSRRARHGLPARPGRTADGFVAQTALDRLGDHAVQRRGAPAPPAHRQGAGARRRRRPGRAVRRPDDPAGRRLHQQLLAFRQALPDLYSGGSRIPDRQTLARQLLRRFVLGRERARIVVRGGRRHGGRGIRLAVQPLPLDLPHGDARARASTTTVMQQITRTAGEVLPDDIGTAWSGTSYQEANASKTGGLVYLLALVFVFLALAALYESWGLPLAILMSVPVAVLGAVLFIGVSHLLDAFFVNDVYMQISLVMLIGLAAKNAILVVEYADRLFNEKGLSLMDAAIGAAKLRVRPIIMTAFAFILGVMPLVFASGVYATARNIMGVALVGGMLFATLLGIFVYPALYYFVGRIGNFERRRERKKQEEKL